MCTINCSGGCFECDPKSHDFNTRQQALLDWRAYFASGESWLENPSLVVEAFTYAIAKEERCTSAKMNSSC